MTKRIQWSSHSQSPFYSICYHSSFRVSQQPWSMVHDKTYTCFLFLDCRRLIVSKIAFSSNVIPHYLRRVFWARSKGSQLPLCTFLVHDDYSMNRLKQSKTLVLFLQSPIFQTQGKKKKKIPVLLSMHGIQRPWSLFLHLSLSRSLSVPLPQRSLDAPLSPAEHWL